MWFILLDDIETKQGHFMPGYLLSMDNMTELLSLCEVAKAQCFPTLDAALEWNRNDGWKSV